MSIELKNVTYTYSQGTAYESHALKDINLVIPDGQFIGVIGHTGSGKSTLMQVLAGLRKPDAGQVQRLCTPAYAPQAARPSACAACKTRRNAPAASWPGFG